MTELKTLPRNGLAYASYKVRGIGAEGPIMGAVNDRTTCRPESLLGLYSYKAVYSVLLFDCLF